MDLKGVTDRRNLANPTAFGSSPKPYFVRQRASNSSAG